jgi:ATP-dependent helicase/nuclease subunit B
VPENPPTLTCLPYGEDVLRRLAERVIHEQEHLLPDLTRITLLLPSAQVIAPLRHHLLQAAEAAGHGALLGPEIDTLAHWVRRQAGDEQPVLAPHQRELLLVEALTDHSSLYGAGSPWTLADSLLDLFDEMTARLVTLPADANTFIAQLAAAYGLPGTDHSALGAEARLVHTLWHAWHEQLRASHSCDPQTDYLLKLGASLTHLPPDRQFYLAGFDHFTPAEASWLRQLLVRRQARLLVQGAAASAGDYHPGAVIHRLSIQLGCEIAMPEPAGDYGRCLQQAFDTFGPPLRERALAATRQFPLSPIAPRLSLFAAGSAEEEARAVDLQARRWLLEGRVRIGIVTENRRLARRVRALLERSGIVLQDAAGWALSTTSAAAVLERWLQTVEEGFAHQPLLDLLKSPFLWPEAERETKLAVVYRFEQGIVLKENVGRDLARYRKHLRYRQERLPADLAADYEPIYSLLEMLEQAAAPLQALLDGRPHAPAAMLAALQESLARLGLTDSLAQDSAGQRVLEELSRMQAAAGDSRLRLTWLEFRAWLGRTLERFNFQPKAETGQVQLLGLAQSALCRFDALIIAGAEREYLPGTNGSSPFFNDGVRAALGLSTAPERLARRYHQFRCLLEAADDVLITRRKEQDGEDVVASPWLETLQSFHCIAFDNDLLDAELALLVNQPDTLVTNRQAPLPATQPPHPSTTAPPALLPKAISASGYQQLVDCPYQFFAARCLSLEPPEVIREMLEKSDYGERVHRCLQAFHSKVAGLPGPFAERITQVNRASAIRCLEDITAQVFAQDLEDNFLHRGWLKRWRERIPDYVEWQMQRAQAWRVAGTELNVEAANVSGPSLKGRLDRLDEGQGGVAIIDYKTGRIPRDEDVEAGEAVQLPFYAALAEAGLDRPVARVDYLVLDGDHVKTGGTLEDEALHDLKLGVMQRLYDLFRELNQGAAMPAWGDEGVCKHCHMAGICRREAWNEK